MPERVVLENREDVRTATCLASGLLHEEVQIPDGEIPEVGTDGYMLERSALSAILIAKTVDRSVIADGSELGYRFSSKMPRGLAPQAVLARWIQRHNHRILDDLIKTDPALAVIAERYQDLAVPFKSESIRRKPQDIRREVLRFDGVVHEADAWLRVASVAASYHDINLEREHALPFVIAKLPTMQITARGDMALQNVRMAIREAGDALGTLHNSADPMDHVTRYKVLRVYVKERTGHWLPAQNFEELYEVAQNPVTGISLSEKPKGFGEIKPFRNTAYGCPASYRLNSSKAEDLRVSALNRLLRAGVAAMAQQNVFRESLGTKSVFVPDALLKLNANLMQAEREATTKPVAERQERLVALAGVHASLLRVRSAVA
ncbi:MAG TPA: hypothetical protein VFB03_04050 [Candidatus Saccharimonadales bacterium]|nr:hypothetical protein [Candidatus Saccharimonadales bacterium]